MDVSQANQFLSPLRCQSHFVNHVVFTIKQMPVSVTVIDSHSHRHYLIDVRDDFVAEIYRTVTPSMLRRHNRVVDRQLWVPMASNPPSIMSVGAYLDATTTLSLIPIH